MKMARLLLVDDNRDNLEILTVMLGTRYHVAGCGSAAEALTLLDTFRPDVLVLDIRMTPVDGVQCLEAIRAVAGYARTPAIALTAFAREVEQQAFRAAGFQAVVTKPIIDYGQLEGVIDGVLESAGSSATASTDAPEPDGSPDRHFTEPSILTGQLNGRKMALRGHGNTRRARRA
jgi:CheY-like chemotaxis protein